MINLVIELEELSQKFVCRGGNDLCLFDGIGDSFDEAVGSFIRQNRESLGVVFTTIVDGKASHSTTYGVPRCVDDLGDFELKALERLKK